MDDLDKKRYIAEETLIIMHGGEIPEVAYHGSLYYLTEDSEGPGLTIDDNDTVSLKQAVLTRYQAIILRDLDPDNRDKRIYRGLSRCAVNWDRLVKFCIKEKMDYEDIRAVAADRLREFLHREAADVRSGARSSSINCSVGEVESMAGPLGLKPKDMPERWQELCLGVE